MSVTFYDYEYQNTGMGKLAYTNQSGQITIDVYEAIGEDLVASGVEPQNFPPGGNPQDDWARVFTCYPFLKVTSGLDEFPFTSFPETRYRIGNYSFMVGNEVIINEDDTITKFPYFGRPEFILYERNSLRPFRFVQIKDYLSSVPDEITAEGIGDAPLPALFYYLTSFYFGSNALENGYGLALNIAEGLTFELYIIYTWGTLELPGVPPAPIVIFPF